MCNIEFFASYHRNFLEYCASEKHEIWPKYSLFYIIYENVLEDKRIQKNIPLQHLKCQSCLLGQLCNNEFFVSYHRILLECCATKEHEIWPKYSLIYILYENVLNDESIQKKIALQYLKGQSCLLGQLCNIEFFAS